MRRVLVGVAVVLSLVVGVVVPVSRTYAASIDPTDVATSVQGLNVAVSWSEGDTSGVTGYTVSTVPQSPAITLPPGATSAVLTGLRPGIAYSVQVAAQTATGSGSQVAAPATVRTQAPGGSYVALTPVRLLDTRIGLGAPKGATQLAALIVAGRGGVPATGASAVALNVTVTGPVSAGYVTAYPAGVARPLASNLNFPVAATEANLVVVQVGAGGVVDLYASAPTQLVADVSGYYTTTGAASPTSGLYHALPPSRILDTRNGTGGYTAPVGAAQSIGLQVTGIGGVPATGVSAVALNTTVTAPSASGYVTVYPSGSARPTTSTLNFTAGQTIANRTVVRVGQGGHISLFNYAGTTQIVVDVAGWYTDGSDTSVGGSYYVALPPHRLVDTRNGIGAPQAPVAPGGVLPVQVAGQDGLPAADASTPATAAALTVTVATNSTGMYATVYPSLAARPLASDLNAPQGRIIPNLTLGVLGVDGAEDVYNSGGNSDFVVDLSGYFIGDVHPPTSTISPPPSAVTAVTQGTDVPLSVTIAAGNPAPRIGQIIAAGASTAAPGGVLGQVTSVTTDASGNSVAALQPATLEQALGDADIALNVPLGAADVVSTQAGTHEAPRASGQRGVLGTAQLRARAVANDSGGPITASGTKPCAGDASSQVSVSASFNAALVYEAHIGHHGFFPTLTAKAGIDITEQAGASISFSGSASCEWSAQLAKYTFRPVEFAVGGVPVVIVPVFTLSMHGEAQGNAQVSASISQNFHAQAGLQYQDGSVSTYQSLNNAVSHTGPVITAANADASLAMTGDIEGKLYDLTGPEAAVTVTLRAHANPTETPWWQLTLSIDADAALHIKILIFHLDLSQSFNLANLTIAQASGSAGGSPPVITTTSLPQAQTGHAYSTQLTTADHRTGSWAVIAGSLPAGLSLSGFTISGTPTAAGTAHFTLQFTDTTGHSVQAPASLTVNQGAGPSTGAISGRVTDTRGDALNSVLVSLYLCSPFCVKGPINGTSTTADGTYEFTDIADSTGPAGSGYVVCFDGSSATGGISDATGYVFTCYGYSITGNQATRLNVNGGLTTSGIGASLTTGGAVSGHLTDSSGHPLAYDGFAEAVQSSFGGLLPDPSLDPYAFTDADGNYVIKGIDQGYYAICADGDVSPATPSSTGYGSNCYGNLPTSIALSNAIPVTAGETDTGIGMALGKGSAVSGKVTDTAGRPLSNVTVYISGQSATNPSAAGYATFYYVDYTAADGTYAVGNLTPGTAFDVCFDGANATGTGSAPFGYAFGCYNGKSGYNDATLVPITTAGQFLTGINGRLAAKTSATGSSDPAPRLRPQTGPLGMGAPIRNSHGSLNH